MKKLNSQIIESLKGKNGITWHLRKKRCSNKRNCLKCLLNELPPHGPYLEGYFKKEGKTRYIYIKKTDIPDFEKKTLEELVRYVENEGVQLKLTDLIK